MNKSQALQSFWSGFGIPAYDENTVPDDVPEKYITYNVATGSLGGVINLYARIWELNSTSWQFVETKAEEIAEHIATMEPPAIRLDNGWLYLTQGVPYSQRMNEPSSDLTRCVYLNLQAEFETAY